jgi:hypothetical protein
LLKRLGLVRAVETTELLPLGTSFYSTCIFADNSPAWPVPKLTAHYSLVRANPLPQSGIVFPRPQPQVTLRGK